MTQFTRAWGHYVIQYRKLILLITAVLMVCAPLSYSRLYYDNSNDAYFLENDPNLLAFDNLLELFGDSEYLVIGVEARPQEQDVFSADSIAMIAEITEFLEDHEHITQVRSLSKYQYTHDDNDELATDDLFEDHSNLAEQADVLDQARQIMAGEQLALDTLISRDFKHTRIIARVEYLKGQNAHNVTLVSELADFIDAQGYENNGFNLRLSGSPVINERFETLTLQDQKILNPAMGVLMIIILLIVFRSFFAMSVPLIVIVATLMLLTSIQAILSFPNTAVSSALIPTMIILSVGASVHVLVEFFQARRKGLDPQDAAAETAQDLFFAILLTSLTTSFGFIALSITDLLPVKQFAVLAAIGPMIIFLITTTTLPAILSFVPWLPRNSKTSENPHVSYFLEQFLPDFTLKYRRAIGLTGLVITLFSIYSIQHIRVDTNVVNYFKQDAWVNQDLHYFNDNFKGISNLEVIVDTGQEGGVKDPAMLQRAEALQVFLESFKETGKANSVLDFYKQINQSLNEDNADFFKLPNSRPMAAQFLLMYENTGPEEDLSDLKDFNEQYLRISIPVLNMDATEQTRLLDAIRDGIAENFADLELTLTGSLVMNNSQNNYVNKGMFQSFGIAILVIGLSFIVLFGSFKYGVIALLPSIVPVILTGGLISYAGIALDLGTMIVGAMTIGIAVDDAIHVMSRYRLMKHKGLCTHDAIRYALRSSGRAVVLTSIILITGFSVMLFGNFIPFIYIGLFSAMIMLFALIGDLIFMPALLYITDGLGRRAPNQQQNQNSKISDNTQDSQSDSDTSTNTPINSSIITNGVSESA